MIVRDHPSAFRLFLVMQGSIVPRIAPKILSVAFLSAGVIFVDQHIWGLPHISISAMGVFGIALSLFLGFRNNAAYDRWWEARQLWGSLIADSRTLARNLTAFSVPPDDCSYILRRLIAFAHLHKGFLRNSGVTHEVSAWLDAEETKTLETYKNPADAALRQIADRIGQLAQNETLSGFGQMSLSGTLASLGKSQAGCERIASTPLPFVYSLLVRRTAYLYCLLLPFALIESASWFTPALAAIVAYVFFGLQAVTNELEQPFSNVQNGLPLDAMCRTIEISASEAMGHKPPDPLLPVNNILT